MYSITNTNNLVKATPSYISYSVETTSMIICENFNIYMFCLPNKQNHPNTIKMEQLD